MEFGMFHEFQWSPGASAADAFAQSFAQVDAAESWGLDAMWLAELHFAPERSVLASPLILAAAIAQISQGRLIFGVGRSGFAHTYKTYGVDYAESRERFNETLQIVKLAFAEERFSH